LRDFLLYFFKIEFFIYSFFFLYSLFIIHYSLWLIILIVFVPVLLFLKILFNHYFHLKLTLKLLLNVLPVSMRLLHLLDLTFAPHFFINTSLFTLTTILFPPLKTFTKKSLSLGLHSHHLKNLIGVVFDLDIDLSILTTFHASLLFHFLIFLLFP